MCRTPEPLWCPSDIRATRQPENWKFRNAFDGRIESFFSRIKENVWLQVEENFLMTVGQTATCAFPAFWYDLTSFSCVCCPFTIIIRMTYSWRILASPLFPTVCPLTVISLTDVDGRWRWTVWMLEAELRSHSARRTDESIDVLFPDETSRKYVSIQGRSP